MCSYPGLLAIFVAPGRFLGTRSRPWRWPLNINTGSMDLSRGGSLAPRSAPIRRPTLAIFLLFFLVDQPNTQLQEFLFALVINMASISQFDYPDCQNSSFLWAFNSLQQSPCLVALALENKCNSSIVQLPVLETPQYSPPTQEQFSADPSIEPCFCNTVYYSMLSACALCQGGGWPSWSDWSSNCAADQVSVDSWPGGPESIPLDIAIPSWAYFDITADGTWSEALAEENTHNPDSTAVTAMSSTTSSESSSSSVSGESSTPDVTPTSQSSPAPSASQNNPPSSDKRTPIAAIAGGVVGGFVGACILAGPCIVFLLRRRRRRNRYQNTGTPKDEITVDSTQNAHGGGDNDGTLLPASQTGITSQSDRATQDEGSTRDMTEMAGTMILGRKLYDPSDPSTFPPPLSDSIPSQTGTFEGRRGFNASPAVYSGLPEV